MLRKIAKSPLKSPTILQKAEDIDALLSGKSSQIESVRQRLSFLLSAGDFQNTVVNQ